MSSSEKDHEFFRAINNTQGSCLFTFFNNQAFLVKKKKKGDN